MPVLKPELLIFISNAASIMTTRIEYIYFKPYVAMIYIYIYVYIYIYKVAEE